MGIASGFDTTAFLAAQLADCATQWSLGTFGALAEFTRDNGERAAVADDPGMLSVVTDRGGIRLEPSPEMRAFASESLTRETWSHRVALCLPADRCGMSRRSVLTELGPDAQALRPPDRDGVLFDLGLDALQVDACIRVADPDIAARLRPHVGRSVFEPGNPAMGIVVPAGPHRVFISRLGRIEVYQPIPPPDGKSPDGPHTHVLPKLLRHGRTHAATEPVPDGFVPCVHLYPAHPIKDELGRTLPFDAQRHDCFQDMLRRFGDPDAIALKRQVMAAVAEGHGPSVVVVPQGRFARANVRVAVRQLRASHGSLPALSPWIAAWDQGHPVAEDVDETEAMHG